MNPTILIESLRTRIALAVRGVEGLRQYMGLGKLYTGVWSGVENGRR